MSTARTDQVAVAAYDRAGTERGQRWTEATSIIGPQGWVLAEVGPGEGITIADIDLSLTADKSVTEHVDLLADRRLDLY